MYRGRIIADGTPRELRTRTLSSPVVEVRLEGSLGLRRAGLEDRRAQLLVLVHLGLEVAVGRAQLPQAHARLDDQGPHGADEAGTGRGLDEHLVEVLVRVGDGGTVPLRCGSTHAAHHVLELVGSIDETTLAHSERPVHWSRVDLDYTFILLTFRRR